MRSIGIPELLVILFVGLIVLLLPAAVVAAILVKRRPSVTPGSRTCTHCGQRIPDIGSFCAFCGQKMS